MTAGISYQSSMYYPRLCACELSGPMLSWNMIADKHRSQFVWTMTCWNRMMKKPLRSNKRVIAKAQAVGVWALPLTAFNPVNKDAKGLSTRNMSERERERENDICCALLWSKPHCTTQTWSKSLLEMWSDLVPPSDFSHQNRLTYANMLSIASSKIAAETRSVPTS